MTPPGATEARTVVVAEPSALIADILTTALDDSGFRTVRFTAEPARLIDEVRGAGALVLLIGPSFGRSGLAAVVRQLLREGVRTVLVSPRALDRVDAQIMLAGASGHLSVEGTAFRDVAGEVERVVRGSSPLHPDVVRSILEQWRDSQTASARSSRSIELTPRELDVVRGLSDGLTTRLIAARLGIAEKTVEAHKSRLFAKVGAKNSRQALTLVSAQGLI